MSSTIKLKKSSIAGRVPSASDLEYGEIAINIADGKLYFKNSSNAIQSFEAGDLGVDSATVLSLIDSSHIQARQIDEGLDSAEVNTLIASGLQNAFSRILVDGQFDVVSDSTQDGLTFEAGHNITITTVPNDDTITFTTSAIGADSVTSLIDSSFVQARQDYAYASLTGAPTSLSPDGVDSSATIALIDSAYVQARQTIGSGFDSADVISLIDSAYVLARSPSQDFLDSAEALALIDSDYVFSRVSETNYTYQLGTDADSNNGTGLNYLSTAAAGHGVAIQPDGSQLFVGDSRTVKVWGNPTTTWDVSTYSRLSNNDKDFTTDIGSNNITDFGFNDDGTRMYIINGGSVIRQFDLSTAYRPSTASYTSTDYYNPTDVGNLNGFGFSDDGTKLILSSGNITSTLGTNADGVRSYTLSTAWDVTTATYDNKEIITGYRGDDYERIPMSSYFANNGKDFFIYGQQQRRVQHFPLATAYDITSYTTRNQLDQMHSSGSYSNAVEIVFDQNLYIAVGNSNLGSVGFSSTGTYVGFNDLVRNLIDSDYVIARAPATGLDSSSTIALIDSSYVQARQTTADLTNYRTVTQIESMIDSNVNAVIDAAPGALDTLNELAAALGDDANFSTTITNQIATKIDSAAASNIIISDVDKAFVDALGINATQLNSQAASYYLDYNNFTNTPTIPTNNNELTNGAGYLTDAIDSARVTSLIDSAYVQARQLASSGIDSASVLSLIDSSYILARDGVNDSDTLFTDKARFFDFTADSGQTSFTGVKYTPGKQQVYLNGVLLVDSADYTATTGSTIVLTQGADSGNTLSVIGYETLPVGAATTITTFNYEADSGQTTFSGIADNGGTLEYTSGKLNVYLNGVLLVDSADYTATNGTSVVLNTAADSGNQLSIISYITTSVGTLDSTGVTNLIDSAYIQARQSASSSFDSNSAINLIDSAYVQARQSTTDLTNYRTVTQIQTMIDSDIDALVDAAPGALNTLNELAAALGDDANFSTTITNSIAQKIDSNQAIAIVDSAYVQARQNTTTSLAFSAITSTPTTIAGYGITDAFDGAYSSLTGVPSTFAPIGVDSNATFAIIDSAYVQARQLTASDFDSASAIALIDSAYVQARQVSMSGGATSITNTTYIADSGDTSFAASYTIGKLNVYLNGILLVDSDDYDATNGSSVILTTAADSGDTVQIVAYTTQAAGTLDSTGVTGLIDSAYVQARQTAQDFAYGSLTGVPSTFAPSGVDSAATIALIDSAYVLARAPAQDFLDSSEAIALIDSSYVQARQTAQDFAYGSLTGVPSTFAPDGVDSAATVALIDSAYVQARQAASSSFDSASAIALIDSAYVQARTLASGIDSAAVLNLIDSAYISARDGFNDSDTLFTDKVRFFNFTADSGQTSFTGVKYTPGRQQVYLNGVLLVDSADYTATTGSTIVLTQEADSGNTLSVIGYETLPTAAATTITTFNYEADSGQTTFSGTADNGGTLEYTAGKLNVYLNGVLLVDSADYTATNGTSVVLNTAADSGNQLSIISYITTSVGTLDSSGVTNLIDSAYVQARQSASSAFDSNNAIGLIDSAYVQARQTAQDFAYGSLTGVPSTFAPTGVDSSATFAIIDSAYVQARQTSTDLTNYRTVTQIQSMIDSDLDALVDAAPGSLNTLNELAAALGDDANFSTTVTNSIAAKLPLAGGTMSGDINLDNNDLLNINYLSFNDPGVGEGIRWTGGNGWQIFESPDNMTNAGGNLQFTTGTSTSDRMMTVDTNGNLELPTGRLTQISNDPLRVRSSTNASPVSIEFSDASSSSYSQAGTISYTHSDAASTSAGISGANEVFIIEGTETVTGIKLDGRLLVTDSAVFQGNVDFGSNQITYSNVYSQTSDLPSASTYHGMFAHVHATGKGYFAHSGNWIELANNSQLANSSNWDTAYGWGDHASAGYLTSAIDSSGVISLIDSSYVQARQSSAGSGSGLDSASTISLIDSAYIQARQTSGGGSTVDSADIIAIVDSDYIQARQSTTGSTTITTGGAFAARTYHYTASANQTAFSGADDNGEILTITDSDANVYLNGILLMRTTDYTVGSNSITLQSGADSDNIISIVAYTGNHLDSNYILSRVSGGATTTTFTATANQTVFSGGGFTYKPDNLTVFYNGILLLDSDDYTATDGTSITLTSGATAGHKLTAVAYTMGNAVNGVDVTTSTFTATDGQTVFNNLDDNGNRLSYNVNNAAIYLNGILLSPADYTANNSTRVELTEAADSGNILTVMSYAGSQQTITADSSSWYEVSTSTYSAAATDKLFVDVSSAAATVTLPTSPSMGDEVRVIDATGNAATNNITIDRNGSKINGADSDLTLDIDRAAVGLVYYNAAQGWILMER